MTRRTFLTLCGAPVIPIRATMSPREFVVVVHKSNQFDSISRSRLSFLFQRKISRWPWGAEVLPIELGQGDAHTSFTSNILHTTPEALAVYWIDQKATRNVDPPLRVGSPEAAISAVAARAGAIAYVPPGIVDNRVKLLRLE